MLIGREKQYRKNNINKLNDILTELTLRDNNSPVRDISIQVSINLILYVTTRAYLEIFTANLIIIVKKS